jgi:signal transduction histidine kinase
MAIARALESWNLDKGGKELKELAEALSEILISSSSLEEVGKGFAAELKKLMEIDWTLIALIDNTKVNNIHLLPFSPNISSEWESGDITYLASSLEWVAKNKKPLVEDDLTRSQLWVESPLFRRGLASVAYLPLFSRGEVFGSLIVSSYHPHTYKERNLRLLKYAAIQLSLPVENYRLLEEAKKKMEEQAFINNLIRGITFSKGIPQAVQFSIEQLRKRISVDRLSIATIQGERLFINVSVSPGNSPSRAGESYPLKNCGAGWVVEHRVPNVEKDLVTERQFPIDDLFLKQGMRSAIRLPLFTREGVFATLNLASRQPNAYGEEEIRFLEEFSNQLAPTIEKIYLRSKEKEGRGLLTAITHEVKTPLTSILCSGKLLEQETKQAPGTPQAKLVENMTQSAQHMGSRLAHFLDLATIQDVNFELPTELLDIKPVLQQAVLQLLPTTHDNDQLLFMELSEPLPRVRANPQRLEQVVSILLNNAIAFSPQGGRINLRASKQDAQLVIRVQDSGDGFSPEEQEELLKPYHPSEVDHHRFPQLRLELAIAKRLVELHGGNLWMKSEARRGSTFTFTLPLAS